MKRRLRDILDSPEAAKEIAAGLRAEKDAERRRIRAKLSETDRAFMDAVRIVFPTARLVAIHFADGEKKGEL